MSGDVVIRVEGLGKKYLIGHHAGKARADTLRDAVVRAGRRFARALVATARGEAITEGDSIEEFWALKNVSFEVKRGEVIGIIGRNGAGKSTLLKILSRVTDPSEGRVTIRGRVASLLEVGTGFHPELSGRENIYLNGALLGMTRAAIKRKFDEIVAFSGVERFIDTPVKRYSSGMYVRLAFAVAAHLEPDILIVDEVLAVGDVEFQRKCLGKISEVTGAGRTVLLVSHNLGAIISMADRALVLERGEILYEGSAEQAVQRYIAASRGEGAGWVSVKRGGKPSSAAPATIGKVRLRGAAATVRAGDAIAFELSVDLHRMIDRLRVSFTIFRLDGSAVGSGFSNEVTVTPDMAGAAATLAVTVRPAALAPGEYYFGVSVGRGNNKTDYAEYDTVHDCLPFELFAADAGAGTAPLWRSSWGSVLFENTTLELQTAREKV